MWVSHCCWSVHLQINYKRRLLSISTCFDEFFCLKTSWKFQSKKKSTWGHLSVAQSVETKESYSPEVDGEIIPGCAYFQAYKIMRAKPIWCHLPVTVTNTSQKNWTETVAAPHSRSSDHLVLEMDKSTAPKCSPLSCILSCCSLEFFHCFITEFMFCWWQDNRIFA